MAHLNLFLRRFRTTIISMFVLSIPAVAGVLPLFNPEDVIKNDSSFYMKADIFLANDPASLKNLFSGFKGKLHQKSGKNIALANERFDLGYLNNYFGYIGYTYREEIFMSASQNTIELLYLTTNKKDLQVGKNYNLNLEIKAFQVQGLTFANKWQIYNYNGWQLSLGGGLELLYGNDMQDGYVSGNGVVTSKKDYDFQATSDYTYTHNYLYKYSVKSATAYGYSSHLSLYLHKNKLSFLLLSNDLLGKLYWDKVPYSTVKLNSNNKTFDSNGYVHYNPTISGKEGYYNYTQTLLQKWRFEGNYAFSNSSLSLGSDYIYTNYLPYINYNYHVTKNLDLKTGYGLRFNSFNLGMRYKNYTFSIRSDDLFQPSTLGLALGARF